MLYVLGRRAARQKLGMVDEDPRHRVRRNIDGAFKANELYDQSYGPEPGVINTHPEISAEKQGAEGVSNPVSPPKALLDGAERPKMIEAPNPMDQVHMNAMSTDTMRSQQSPVVRTVAGSPTR